MHTVDRHVKYDIVLLLFLISRFATRRRRRISSEAALYESRLAANVVARIRVQRCCGWRQESGSSVVIYNVAAEDSATQVDPG
jgi:hypothetical protein